MHMMKKGAATKDARERKAADRIYGLLPEDQGQWLKALWEEFEAYETPEAKFAHVLDNCQPLFLNDASNGRSWEEHQVKKSQIYKRNRKTGEGSEVIWEYMKELIDKHIAMGHVIDDEKDGEKKLDECMRERYELAKGRSVRSERKKRWKRNFGDFFRKRAQFLSMTADVMEEESERTYHGGTEGVKITSLLSGYPPGKLWKACYGNPAYAAQKLGEYGKAFLFCMQN